MPQRMSYLTTVLTVCAEIFFFFSFWWLEAILGAVVAMLTVIWPVCCIRTGFQSQVFVVKVCSATQYFALPNTVVCFFPVP